MMDDCLDVSILVCAYNMSRELPQTLCTLSRQYQCVSDVVKLEIVVLDNGSIPLVDEKSLQSIIPGLKVVRPADIKQSPATAINRAMEQLSGRLVGLWIDGARMASPGIVRYAVEAWQTDRTRAIGTLAFHLGPDVQMRTVFDGYDAHTEDVLLASIPWQDDGYKLFDISVLAGSSMAGWFGCISETNALFMDKELWLSLGGLDERFTAPGGGFVNLDLWTRAVAASRGRPWIILGEGTFHQVHGGAATNGLPVERDAMQSEYLEIHGRHYTTPYYSPIFVGCLDYTRFCKGYAQELDQYRHVHSVRNRRFNVDMPTKVLNTIQQGTLSTRYKGLRLLKSPFDLSLYMQVVELLRPATIIEIGTSEGGSAVWFLDQCRAAGLTTTRVITIDLSPPSIAVPSISMYQGDGCAPNETFPTDVIAMSPHPWLVIDDSAHTYESVSAILNYFDSHLLSGDMIVVEDGVLADLDGDVYRRLEDGPNRAVADFLKKTGSRYVIDEKLCDFYGYNLTYAPNAWLKRL